MLRNVILSCFAVFLLVPFGGCESNSGGEPAAGSDTPTGAGNRDAAAGDTGRAGAGGSDSGASGEVAGGECPKNPDDPSRFVIIGFHGRQTRSGSRQGSARGDNPCRHQRISEVFAGEDAARTATGGGPLDEG